MNKIIKWVKNGIIGLVYGESSIKSKEESVESLATIIDSQEEVIDCLVEEVEEEREKRLGCVRHTKNYRCGYCWFRGTETGIRLHLKYSHDVIIDDNYEENDIEYTCRMCGDVSKSKYACREHMKRCGRRMVIKHFQK